MPGLDWPALENFTHRDPGGRGVVARHANAEFLDAGQLARAAQELAEHGRAVGIVTGFTIADAEPPAAETDGPPGALYLARVFHKLGIEVRLLCDSFATPLLVEGCRTVGVPTPCVHELPIAPRNDDHDWLDAAIQTRNGVLSHLIAIERVGPSHTLDSLTAQTRDSAAPVETFVAEVPLESRDVCHSMRGIPISHLTAPAQRLFELPGRPYRTIGIGDGGNEIGLGCIPWEVLRSVIARGPAGKIACRIATDHLLLAGVSNWAGYALGAAVAALRGQQDLISEWTDADERILLERLVAAGAVDGVTKQRTATVDGLSWDDYVEVFNAIRRQLSA